MSLRQFTNNASTTLAASITSGATSLSVTAGAGSLFPALTGNQFFMATLLKNGNPSILEIIKVTARTGDTFNAIQRAQEGTTALAWNAGDQVALLPTAGDMAGFAQFDDLQQQLPNFALDVGPANAYSVTLTPALTAHVVGMPIRFKAGHTNTGASTFNDGVGAASLTLPNGQALGAGAITAGGIYTATWDGSKFQTGGSTLSASTFSGTLTGGFTSNPSGTFNYQITGGGTAHIWLNSDVLGTRNANTDVVLTGLPALLTPSSVRVVPVFGLKVVSVSFLGFASISGTSILINFAIAGQNAGSGNTNAIGILGGGWPSTGQAGLGAGVSGAAGFSVTYGL